MSAGAPGATIGLAKAGHHLAKAPAVGAVLLAAGAGSRMGTQPKALLQLDGVPLVRRQLIALAAAGIDQIVVVLGHHADRIEPWVNRLPVTLVRHPRPDEGQVSSLRRGLAALRGPHDAVLVALADQPLIGPQDIRDLISAYTTRPTGTQLVQPQVDGLPGNPVVFSRSVQEAILAGEDRLGCRQWQAAHPDQVHRWVSSNHHYRTDVDTPEDIESLARDSGHRLVWPASAPMERSA